MIKKIRGYLLTGLVFWLPIFVTVIIISSLLEWLNNVESVLPQAYRPSTILGYSVPGIGVVIALALFIVTGILVTNWLGQKFVNLGESFLQRIPLVRVIYHTTKQIIQALLISNGKSFRQVVMIQYPKANTWTLAFLTGEIETNEVEGLASILYTVYVPTTPNPTSGFFLMLEEKEFIRLDISVEEALKMILSLGAIPQSLFKTKR